MPPKGRAQRRDNARAAAASRTPFVCFTANLPEAIADRAVRTRNISFLFQPCPSADLAFIVCQVETAPQTGQVHVQGYCEFTSKRRLPQGAQWTLLSRSLPREFINSVHVEGRRGTQEQAIEYCVKDDSSLLRDEDGGEYRIRFSAGVPVSSRQGRRTDLVEVVETLQHGMAARGMEGWSPILREIYVGGRCDIEIAARYPKYIASVVASEARARIRAEQLFRYRQNILILGPTGVGKSLFVGKLFAALGIPYYVGAITTERSAWYEGYGGETITVWDDTKPPSLLNALRTFGRADAPDNEIKGGSVPNASTLNIIMSNVPPCTWYPGSSPEHVAALERRFDSSHYDPIADAEHGRLGITVRVSNLEMGRALPYAIIRSLSLFHAVQFFPYVAQHIRKGSVPDELREYHVPVELAHAPEDQVPNGDIAENAFVENVFGGGSDDE